MHVNRNVKAAELKLMQKYVNMNDSSDVDNYVRIYGLGTLYIVHPQLNLISGTYCIYQDISGDDDFS